MLNNNAICWFLEVVSKLILYTFFFSVSHFYIAYFIIKKFKFNYSEIIPALWSEEKHTESGNKI